jgi:hypothetical protein
VREKEEKEGRKRREREGEEIPEKGLLIGKRLCMDLSMASKASKDRRWTV